MDGLCVCLRPLLNFVLEYILMILIARVWNCSYPYVCKNGHSIKNRLFKGYKAPFFAKVRLLCLCFRLIILVYLHLLVLGLKKANLTGCPTLSLDAQVSDDRWRWLNNLRQCDTIILEDDMSPMKVLKVTGPAKATFDHLTMCALGISQSFVQLVFIFYLFNRRFVVTMSKNFFIGLYLLSQINSHMLRLISQNVMKPLLPSLVYLDPLLLEQSLYLILQTFSVKNLTPMP